MSLVPLAPPAITATARQRGRLGVAFGERMLVLWLVGLVLCIPVIWNRSFLYAVALWDAVLLLAWVADLLTLPKPGQISVERRWLHALSLGASGRVSLRLENTSGSAIRGFLTDETPLTLRDTPPKLSFSLPAHSEMQTEYAIHPRQRGNLTIGRIHLRYSGVLRLAERWAVADLNQEVRVYPDFEQAQKQAIYLTRSRQIEKEQRQIRLRGQGREFESLRDYREGDEFRDICWTATARRAKLVTKVHQIERSQPVWVVLDSGRLMRARTDGFTKLDHAVNGALCLAQLALFSGDRIGMLAYGRKVTQRIAPGRGAAHLRYIIEQLSQVHDELPEADHLRAASSLLTAQKRRSLIVWITDLAETSMTPEVVEAASRMLSRHLLLFVLIGQPDLMNAAAGRPKNAEDMYRAVAAQEMVYRRDLLLGRLRERGALAVEVAPKHLTATILNQYLSVKERMLL